MKKFFERNERLLRFYCVVGRVIGWLMLIGGVLWFSVLVINGVGKGSIEDSSELLSAELLLFMISAMLFGFLLPGLVALGVTQLITYFYEPQAKPGLIIRRADKILYAYGVFLVIRAYYAYWWVVHVKFMEPTSELGISNLLFAQPFILPTIAKVLILIGAGLILRRLLPVIEESKTLV